MRRNSTAAIGALHPVLFMSLVYIISIVLALLVCRIVYFSIHRNEGTAILKVEKVERLVAAK